MFSGVNMIVFDVDDKSKKKVDQLDVKIGNEAKKKYLYLLFSV